METEREVSRAGDSTRLRSDTEETTSVFSVPLSRLKRQRVGNGNGTDDAPRGMRDTRGRRIDGACGASWSTATESQARCRHCDVCCDGDESETRAIWWKTMTRILLKSARNDFVCRFLEVGKATTPLSRRPQRKSWRAVLVGQERWE